MVFFFPIALMVLADDDDRNFIESLYLKNARAMYLMALKIVRDHQTACDIVSEACLRMIEKISYLREINCCKLTPYIISIVRNTAYQYLRKQKAEQKHLEKEASLMLEADSGVEIDDDILLKAEIEEIQIAWNRISYRSRELLRMRCFEQLDDSTIASAFHISKGSARVYLTRARRELKDELEKGGII